MTRSRWIAVGRWIFIFACAAWGLGAVAHAQGIPKLAAPVYSGASMLECSTGDISTSCVFGTQDSIDKVKAFYDKAVGGLHEMPWGYLAALRAGKQVSGEGETSTVFATLRIAHLPPVTMPPPADPKAGQAAAKMKYMSVLANGVVWEHGSPMSAEQRKGATDQGFRTPQEFAKAFQQYGHLEAAYYPQDKADAARKSYDDKISEIQKKYTKLGQEAGQQNQANFEQMQKDNARRRQDLERERQANRGKPPTEQQKKDYEELKRILTKNNPARGKRFVEVHNKMVEEEKAGTFNMQTGMEMGQILEEDPEARAYAEKMQKRDEANRPPANPGADALVKGMRSSQALLPQQMNETWQAGLEYLAAMNKIHSRTRIQISGEKFGADAGGIVTDRAAVEALWAKRKTKGEEAEDTDTADRSQSGGARKSADAGAASPKPASGSGSVPAKEPEKKEGFGTDDAVNAGKQGINLLKKLF